MRSRHAYRNMISVKLKLFFRVVVQLNQIENFVIAIRDFVPSFTHTVNFRFLQQLERTVRKDEKLLIMMEWQTNEYNNLLTEVVVDLSLRHRGRKR